MRSGFCRRPRAHGQPDTAAVAGLARRRAAQSAACGTGCEDAAAGGRVALAMANAGRPRQPCATPGGGVVPPAGIRGRLRCANATAGTGMAAGWLGAGRTCSAPGELDAKSRRCASHRQLESQSGAARAPWTRAANQRCRSRPAPVAVAHVLVGIAFGREPRPALQPAGAPWPAVRLARQPVSGAWRPRLGCAGTGAAAGAVRGYGSGSGTAIPGAGTSA